MGRLNSEDVQAAASRKGLRALISRSGLFLTVPYQVFRHVVLAERQSLG